MPAAQLEHDEAPPALKVPSAQLKHDDAPPELYLPAAQREHDNAPAVALKVPAVHVRQSNAPVRK